VHDQRSTTLLPRNFRIIIPGRSYRLPLGGKFHQPSGLYTGHRKPVNDSVPGLKCLVDVSKGPFIPASRELPKRPYTEQRCPALFNGSGAYPYKSTPPSYIFRYPFRSPAFQLSMARLKTSRLLIGSIVTACPIVKVDYCIKAWPPGSAIVPDFRCGHIKSRQMSVPGHNAKNSS
jgi:hypothetical protein